jgi:DeoR family transcriptional regulator, ulaG and ulaABCDEF operon transcriptional repressor
MNHQYRHKHLLRLLAEHGSATIPQLSGWLGVSAATVRRDIRLLDTAAQLRRVHGGARRIDGDARITVRNATWQAPVPSHPERKRAIARRAATLCADGDTVLIGGGTTTLHLVEFLAPRHFRVVTNSFAVARGLLASSNNDVILSGGRVYREQGILHSPFESEAVQFCYAHRVFMGTQCLSPLGLMEADPLLIQDGRRLIGQAREVVVLADSSKFGNRGGMFLCALDRIATVITDTGAPDAGVQMLERAGVRVLLVDPDGQVPPH